MLFVLQRFDGHSNRGMKILAVTSCSSKKSDKMKKPPSKKLRCTIRYRNQSQLLEGVVLWIIHKQAYY